MAETHRSRLTSFFARYAEAIVTRDIEAITSAYVSPYLEASPASVVAFEIDAAYRRQLRERSEAMARLGLRDAAVGIKDVHDVSDGHWLVRTGWTLRFERPEAEPVLSRFDQSYLVRDEEGRLKILCYISHEDEAAVMKRDGVV